TGPYRVTPNLMVVVPTAKHVSLSYGRTPTDLIAILLTLFGIGVAVWLSGKPAIEMPPNRWASVMGGPPRDEDSRPEYGPPLPPGEDPWGPPPQAAPAPPSLSAPPSPVGEAGDVDG